MTDPAPVLRREVDALIQTQVAILNQTKPLTEVELVEFRLRSEKIRTLFEVMNLSQPLPEQPIHKRKIASATRRSKSRRRVGRLTPWRPMERICTAKKEKIQ